MLQYLNFGSDGAENEQEFLQQVFIATPVFRRVKKGKNWLVLGRKGSGKSAVCLKLYHEMNKQGLPVSLITPANLSVGVKSILEKGSLNSSEASMLLWKYVFIVEVSKHAVKHITDKEGSNYLRWDKSAKNIRKFLIQSEYDHGRWFEKLFRRLRGVRKINIKFMSFEASAEREAFTQEVNKLRDILGNITIDLRACIQKYVKQKISLFVDKVDEVWGYTIDNTDIVIGLLRACMQFREEFSTIEVLLFLRSDIYEKLRFPDSDKYHSSEERITWDEESLLWLISSRIYTTTSGESSSENIISQDVRSNTSVWRKVFPYKIDGEDSFKYLLRYTLMRPRDLIQLCNHCQDVAENAFLDTIDEKSIRKALPQYSSWKLKDLEDEYITQYPFLNKVFWAVFQNAPHRFDRTKLNQLIEPYLQKLCDEFGDSYFKPLDRLLQVLVHIGFIGAVRNAQIIYFYHGFQVFVPYTTEFVIHPAFRPTLNIYAAEKQELSDVEGSLRPQYSLMTEVSTQHKLQKSTLGASEREEESEEDEDTWSTDEAEDDAGYASSEEGEAENEAEDDAGYASSEDYGYSSEGDTDVINSGEREADSSEMEYIYSIYGDEYTGDDSHTEYLPGDSSDDSSEESTRSNDD